ncbi:YciI family protein, partial [Escherichia coli]|uniref:YciI family protein n=1 Tax=Escherichia coli TaxID=562 RepID=UPI002B2486F4
MMPLFAVICRDKPDHLQTRMDTRERHLAYVGENPGVLLAGPFLEDGKPCGSLLIVEGDSLGAVADWAAQDPYAQAGPLALVAGTAWRRVGGRWASGV